MNEFFSFRDESIYCHHSRDVAPNPAAFPIHAHETPEVFFFISGKGSFLVEGTRYALSPGDILLMRPAETHKLLISPEVPYERVAIHFSAELFDSLDGERRLTRPFFDRPLGQRNRYPASENPSLGRALADLSLTPGMERLQIISCLLEVLAKLAVIWEREKGPLEPEGGFSMRLVSHVNAHLFEEISLESVSEAFEKSVSQVGRCFRKATGTSLWEYVLLKRLLAARARIARGDAASDASVACGFNDYSAFYRAYKKRFGHAPSADRS